MLLYHVALDEAYFWNYLVLYWTSCGAGDHTIGILLNISSTLVPPMPHGMLLLPEESLKSSAIPKTSSQSRCFILIPSKRLRSNGIRFRRVS